MEVDVSDEEWALPSSRASSVIVSPAPSVRHVAKRARFFPDDFPAPVARSPVEGALAAALMRERRLANSTALLKVGSTGVIWTGDLATKWGLLRKCFFRLFESRFRN